LTLGTHLRRLGAFGVFWEVGESAKKLFVKGENGSREKEVGDKRTGPALNPLKGSSARAPRE